MEIAEQFIVGFYLFAALIAVLWILLPLAVFSINGKANKTMMEAIRVRQLLEQIAAQQNEVQS